MLSFRCWRGRRRAEPVQTRCRGFWVANRCPPATAAVAGRPRLARLPPRLLPRRLLIRLLNLLPPPRRLLCRNRTLPLLSPNLRGRSSSHPPAEEWEEEEEEAVGETTMRKLRRLRHGARPLGPSRLDVRPLRLLLKSRRLTKRRNCDNNKKTQPGPRRSGRPSWARATTVLATTTSLS